MHNTAILLSKRTLRMFLVNLNRLKWPKMASDLWQHETAVGPKSCFLCVCQQTCNFFPTCVGGGEPETWSSSFQEPTEKVSLLEQFTPECISYFRQIRHDAFIIQDQCVNFMTIIAVVGRPQYQLIWQSVWPFPGYWMKVPLLFHKICHAQQSIGKLFVYSVPEVNKPLVTFDVFGRLLLVDFLLSRKDQFQTSTRAHITCVKFSWCPRIFAREEHEHVADTQRRSSKCPLHRHRMATKDYWEPFLPQETPWV